MSDLSINLNPNKKQKPVVDSLGFGVHFTDHMFVMDYVEGKGWHNASIEAYAPISLDPSAMVFHYGQAVFEGLKAYLSPEGEIIFFRPEKNLERLAHSNERLCIPAINNDFVLECLKKLVTIEKEWIPTKPGTSLYIRPFIIATDPHVGVRPSTSYKLMIILSPVGAYYPEGLNPVKMLVLKRKWKPKKAAILRYYGLMA